MSRAYIYVVARDFGFAPNPFHGVLTLATCKPGVRRRAELNDWVIGVGGSRLRAKGRCIFAARVTGTKTLSEYWDDAAYRDKRPVRNGSRRMMVGDNIYRRDRTSGAWHQADSHHSYPDGSVNPHNVRVDTSTDRMLVSRHFFYFGRAAPTIPQPLLDEIRYSNVRNYRVFDLNSCHGIVRWLETTFYESLNLVDGDPFDFDDGDMRYSAGDDRVRRSGG